MPPHKYRTAKQHFKANYAKVVMREMGENFIYIKLFNANGSITERQYPIEVTNMKYELPVLETIIWQGEQSWRRLGRRRPPLQRHRRQGAAHLERRHLRLDGRQETEPGHQRREWRRHYYPRDQRAVEQRICFRHPQSLPGKFQFDSLRRCATNARRVVRAKTCCS